MSVLLLSQDRCEGPGCRVSIRYGGAPILVLLGAAVHPNGGEIVKVYCSHRCEALSRPTLPWGNRIPERRS